MKNVTRTLAVIIAVGILTIAAVLPAAAQEIPVPVPAAPNHAITVTGLGSASGSPDTAHVSVGAELSGNNVTEAFAEANTTVQAIINALLELGIERQDIRTNNLSIYVEGPYEISAPGQPRTYRVSNTVEIIVRDVNQVEAVVNAAIEAGATSIYGLSFTVNDPSELEATAREDAVADARARAEQLASLVGAQLGDVITITEIPGGYYLPYASADAGRGGGGGAVIEPGQTNVQISLQVTFQLVR